MISIFRTDDRIIHEEKELSSGAWVNMINPTITEGEEIAKELDIDLHDLLAALDEEESSRVELEDRYTCYGNTPRKRGIQHDSAWYYSDPGYYYNSMYGRNTSTSGICQWQGKRV